MLWQYCRDQVAINDSNSDIVEKMLPLKYWSNFWRTLEILLINYDINLNRNWSKNCVTVATDVADQGATFLITDTKFMFQL